MKLYQAGYFRMGGRGSGSGWKIAAPSPGMSEIAKAGFKGIASRLVDLKQSGQMPQKAMGIFRHDRFIYLMHVNYAASGEDSRGVAYVHGYCFNLQEYFGLAVHPEMLFGILPDQFDLEYQQELSAYPVRESLEYRNMNERRLLDRYRLSKEQYRKLILGAICALEGYSGPMCVKCQGLREQDTQSYRDVMYLVMKGLPYHLRQKLLSFSWQGMQTAIYFSDTVQGDNYADLDTGMFHCDYTRLESCQFTRLYNMDIFYKSIDTREQIFQNIAAFIEDAYTDPFKDAGCALIEAGFQKKVKKNDGGIEPLAAAGLLQDFLKYGLRYGDETAEYLALLLDALNQGGIQLEDNQLVSDIKSAYASCSDRQLLDPMACFDARRILGQKKEKGFSMLLELKQHHADDLYPYVCRHLEHLDPEYFADYYWNQFLPEELTSLKKAERFWKKSKEAFSAEEHRLFQKLLRDLAEQEMKAADSFEELCLAAQVIERICQERPRTEGSRLAGGYPQTDGYHLLWEDTCFLLWNCFNPDWFEVSSVDAYKQYNVQKLAQGYGQKSCPHAKKTNQLILTLEEARECTDVQRLWALLFTGQSEEDKKQRRKIQRAIREEFFSGSGNVRWEGNDPVAELDCSLLLFYDTEKEQFDLVKWISQWADLTDMESLRTPLIEYGRSSKMLADETYKKYVFRYLEDAFKKNKKQSAYSRLPEDQKKALQTLYNSLKGRADSGEAARMTVYSLHREVLSLFVLLSLAVCGICLQRYGSGDIFITMPFAIFCAVGSVLSVTAKVMSGKGSRTDGTGVKRGLAVCLYAGVFLAFVGAAWLVYDLGGFTEKAVCLMVFLGLAAVMVVAGGVVVEEL